jgi:hypothetical protein
VSTPISVGTPSASLITALVGAAALVCGALHLGNLAPQIETVLTAVGGLIIAIVGHHTTKAAVANSQARKTGQLAPPVLPT